MNPTTQQIIEFLSHPELPFGAEEDLLLLADPAALQSRVSGLLQEFPAVLGPENARDLQAHIGEADWNFIASEFRARVALASQFFDGDATTASNA